MPEYNPTDTSSFGSPQPLSTLETRACFFAGLAALFAVILLVAGPAQANRPMPQPDRSMAPHFVVIGDQSVVDGLPLKGSSADVQISGVIARVRITQTYKNEGKKPIEAKYVFPGSTRAAVFGMTMQVGKRTIKAKIEKREAARKIYEQAKAQGKTASLLEQQRPNVFEMNVANILPGDDIKVVLDYTELLIPEGGTYEFVYPAVVGPRFTAMTEKTADNHSKFSNQPYTRAGKEAQYDWDVNMQIDAGMPIATIVSPSHKIHTQNDGQKTKVFLDDGGNSHGRDNRDFVLRYSLRGDAINSGMLLFPGEDENFFLTMVQPPKRVKKSAMPPREYVFIIDVSGSMHGFPLGIAKQVMHKLLDGLRKKDRFNVMLFSGGNRVLSPQSIPATPQNIHSAMSALARVRGGGSTRLLPALKQALAMPAADDMSRTFVVVTDGYVMVEAEAFELIRKNLGNANLFAFGVGSSVNRHLIEGMARAGMGEPFVVLRVRGNDAVKNAAKFKRYIESPALTNIKVAFKGFDAYDIQPSSVPDLFAERPVMVFGKYRGKAKGNVVVTGTSGHGKFKKVIRVSSVEEDKGNDALRYLWARQRIAFLDDLNSRNATQERKDHVTELGLKYNLLTAYTSFVAVDDTVRNAGGTATTVQQPLPLPWGVSNFAVRSKRSRASNRRRPKPAHMKMSRGSGRGSGRVHTFGLQDAPMVAPDAVKTKDKEDTSSSTRPLLTTVGALTLQQAQAVLIRHRAFFAMSLKRLRAKKGNIRGPIVLALRVNAAGRVLSVVVQSGVVSQKDVDSYLTGQLKRMHFPSAGGKSTITITLRL